MKYLISLLLICSFCACSGKKESVTVVTSFRQTGILQAQVQQLPISILLPRYMGIAGEQLYIYKEKEENLFSFFHIPECTYLGDAGTRGQGPDEFNLLDTRSFHSGKEQSFSVMEASSNLLKTVVYEDNQLTVKQKQYIFEKGISNNGFYPLADSVYLTLGRLDEENEYCLFDKKANKITQKGVYPQWVNMERNPRTPPLFVTYIKTCVVHPDGKKFAAFYGRFKRLRIYNNKVRLLHNIDVQVEPYSTNLDENVEEQAVYYIGQPYATNNYIYVLCANSKDSNPDDSDTCELQVWTWDGEAVASFTFDRRISLMAVSEESNKLFALDRKTDNELYIYDLPQIK